MSARTAIRWSPNDVVGAMPVVAGVCWSVSILLTNLGQKSLTGPFGLVDTAGYQVGARALVWALVALFVLAGAVTARQMGDWQAGARSGLACGLGAGVIAFAVTVLMRIAFAHWLGAGGGFDPTAYGLEAALKAGLWHVVFGLLAGGALGAFGGILSLATPGRADAA